MGTDRQIDATTLDDFLPTARQRMRDDRNRNVRVICLTTELNWDDFLMRFEARFTVDALL